MIAEPKQQPPHQGDKDRSEQRRDEKALDEALMNTFPASDPVSVEQPVVPTGRIHVIDPAPKLERVL
jgi:hypothetical protein